MGKVAEAPTPSEVAVQTMLPVEAGAGLLHDQPAGGASETNVAFTLLVGLLLAVFSVNVKPVAVAVPLLVTMAV